jgi:hypothetical protein
MTNEPTAQEPTGDRREAAPVTGEGDLRPRADRTDDDTVTTTVVAIPEPASAAAPADEAVEPADGRHAGAGFPVVLRGYDRQRVDAAFADLRAELDAAVARYEAAEAALGAARAAAAQAEQRFARAEAAAQRATRAAEEAQRQRAGQPEPAALGDRIRRILELAEEEAAEIRATARREADREVAASRAEVSRLQERRIQLGGELADLDARITSLLEGGGSRPGPAPTQ